MVKATVEPQTPQIPILPSGLGRCSMFLISEPPQGGGAILFFFIALRILSLPLIRLPSLAPLYFAQKKMKICLAGLASRCTFQEDTQCYRAFDSLSLPC